MTRKEREAAIEFMKANRKLDESIHNSASKDSKTYYVTDKCLKYWDMAIQALSQEPTEKAMAVDKMEREYVKSKALFHKIVECEDVISREMALKECHDIVVDGDRYSVIQEETLLGLPPVTLKFIV